MNDTKEKSYTLFRELLPYYWMRVDLLPAFIKLKLAISGFTSIQEATTELCLKHIKDRKLRKIANEALHYAQTFGHGMTIDNTKMVDLPIEL